MTTELKPCPFCGGTDLARNQTWVQCRTCHANGPDDYRTSGVESWNAAPRRDDVPVAVAVEETLHDKYVRAAITGIMAHYGTKETPDYVIGEARDVADAAMKARQA